MIDFKNVLLSEIRPDPNQPRKYYDETAMQELTDSVREKGILQPILIRPIGSSESYKAKDPAAPMAIEIRRAAGYKGPAYILVCGERRYRAAIAVAANDILKNNIPAVIRELSDDEALELQIIENLQRKDVHPMEEAVAFKSLLEKGKELKDVAARVGKSDFYIRQRLKLNDLSKKWQAVFYNGRISNATALKVCVLESKLQDELYEDEATNAVGEIILTRWAFDKLKGDLSKAPFPLEDKSLNKKMGACTACSFNSAVAMLFPEHAQDPRCTNINCFKVKVEANYKETLSQYKNDPEIIFVSNEYYNVSKEQAELSKAGHDALKKNSYGVIEAPEKPDWEEFVDDNGSDYDTENELRNSFNEDVATYEKELVVYNKKVASGKFKKAFVIDGDNKGGVVYIELRSNSSSGSGSSKATKQKEDAGQLSAADIDEEIKRIQDRQKRLTELDMEKIHVATLEQLEKSPELKKSGFTSPVERGIMVYLLIDKAGGFQSREFISKNIKSIPAEPTGNYKWHPDYFKKLSAISEADLSLLVRQLAFQEYGNKNTVSWIKAHDTAMRLMAEYLGVNITGIETAQEEIATKRKEKADKRIAALKEQKKALVKPAAKKAKAPIGATEFVKARAAKKTPVPTKKARASRHTNGKD